MERYFSESQRELIFSEVTTAVFMVDSTQLEEKSKEIFDKFLKYIFEFSPDISKVYVLMNKIDLSNSVEDKVYDLLIEGINGDLKNNLAFTPVSVKEGSAQHRLIEILDFEIQRSTLSLQRLGKIRNFLDKLKINTLSEYMLFNQPDGLLIASTIGKFESKPLQFIKFEMSAVESNLYLIYQELTKMLNVQPSKLTLSSVVYESDDNYLLIKEVINKIVIMAITKNKKHDVFTNVMDVLAGDDFENLKEFLKTNEL